MAQHDYVIDNQSFPATRTDINNALLAISSTNSGTTAPSTTYANQLWYDTTNNKLYIRNEDNDAWIPLFLLDQSNDVAGTLATEIDVEDSSGTDTAGTSLTIKGGAGTGTGAGGSIVFQTADGAGSTGSSVNAHATRVTITDDGKVGIGGTPATALDIHGDSHSLRLTDTDTALSDNELSSQIEFYQSDTSGAGVGASIGAYGDGTTGSLQLRFATGANQERMRIEDGGPVLIGTTDSSPAVNNVKGIHLNGGTGAVSFSRIGSTPMFVNRSNSGDLMECRRAGTKIGSISITSVSVSYNTTSDYRLKENVTDITDGITRVKQLDPKRFNFIVEPDTTVDGFLAHEVSSVVPEAITGTQDEVDDDGNPAYQSIDQSKLVPLLTAALQEAIAKIEALETRVAALEG